MCSMYKFDILGIYLINSLLFSSVVLQLEEVRIILLCCSKYEKEKD